MRARTEAAAPGHTVVRRAVEAHAYRLAAAVDAVRPVGNPLAAAVVPSYLVVEVGMEGLLGTVVAAIRAAGLPVHPAEASLGNLMVAVAVVAPSSSTQQIERLFTLIYACAKCYNFTRSEHHRRYASRIHFGAQR